MDRKKDRDIRTLYLRLSKEDQHPKKEIKGNKTMTEIAVKLLEYLRDCRQVEVDALNDAIDNIKGLDKKLDIHLETIDAKPDLKEPKKKPKEIKTSGKSSYRKEPRAIETWILENDIVTFTPEQFLETRKQYPRCKLDLTLSALIDENKIIQWHDGSFKVSNKFKEMMRNKYD
jgi:hypothetical protein